MQPDADTLGRVAMFAGLEAADREALALCFRGRRYKPGDVICREGEPGQSLFLIGEGTLVAASRAGDTVREFGRFVAGEVAFAGALFDRTPRASTLTALGPALVYELEADCVEPLRARAPAAARALLAGGIRGLLGRLHQIEDRVTRELERVGPP